MVLVNGIQDIPDVLRTLWDGVETQGLPLKAHGARAPEEGDISLRGQFT